MTHKNWNITILSNFILLPLTTINFFCTYTHEQIFKVEPNALNYHTTSSLLTGRRWCQKYCIGENYRKTNQKQCCPIKQSFFYSKIATFFPMTSSFYSSITITVRRSYNVIKRIPQSGSTITSREEKRIVCYRLGLELQKQRFLTTYLVFLTSRFLT